jgi:hypothetical protein
MRLSLWYGGCRLQQLAEERGTDILTGLYIVELM